jgi:2-keto-3-deoxy-L-rhamnonate aldolase RhmA
MTRPLPAWRSLLFVPVLIERFLAKAHTRGADALILDLEDSIIPANKEAARKALAAAVPRVAQNGADVVVRINRPLELAVPDIAAAVMPGVAALMLPKVMGPEHVRLLAELVTAREEALGMAVGHTRFLVLIEGPAALPHLYAIAAEPRMAGMSVGGEDMATELGAIPSADSMYVFAMHGLAACRTAGILHPPRARADHQPGIRRVGRGDRSRAPPDRGVRCGRRGRRRRGGVRRQHDRPACGRAGAAPARARGTVEVANPRCLGPNRERHARYRREKKP